MGAAHAPPAVALRPKKSPHAAAGKLKCAWVVIGSRGGCAKNWRQGPGNEVRLVCILMAD